MNGLKPCPFCGEHKLLYSGNCGFKFNDDDNQIRLFGVHCRTCKARTGLFESLDEATKAWNRRATCTNLAEVGTELISRQAAIEAVGKLCDGCDNGGYCGECRIDHPDKDAIDVLEGLPPIQPDKDKVSNLLYHIYSIQSPHLDMTGVIAKKYYCQELWKELFGKESELPWWMN